MDGKTRLWGYWDEVRSFLERYKARFLVEVPMPGFAEEKPFDEVVAQLMAKCPGLLKLAYVAPDSRFTIFEVCLGQKVGCGQ